MLNPHVKFSLRENVFAEVMESDQRKFNWRAIKIERLEDSADKNKLQASNADMSIFPVSI